MKRIILLLTLLLPALTHAQDTFSICAVDPVTGEVGSAGASCIANCIIISDVHPGVGVVHTQSYWLSANKAYCLNLMNQGFSPQAILDSVVANDAQNDSTIRQYGAVDLVGGGRSAAFTGSNCLSWAGHTTSPTFAIQGNILLGQEIIDSMEARFLAEPGSLAKKLMAALQGANVPGADTRCLQYGKPAISAFIRVAKPGDSTGAYYLDIRVNNTAPTVNPLDSLQSLFDQWCLTTAQPAPAQPGHFRLFPNPAHGECWLEATAEGFEHASYVMYNSAGQPVQQGDFGQSEGRVKVSTSDLPRGIYYLVFRDPAGMAETHLLSIQ